jgi:hypothetical protein
MKEKIKKTLLWIKKHREQLLYIAISYLATSYLLNLPYINLIKIYLSSFPLLVAWIISIIIFRPNKEKILVVGLSLFILNFFFSILHIHSISETLGEVSYYMIFTYVLLSLKDVRNKKL